MASFCDRPSPAQPQADKSTALYQHAASSAPRPAFFSSSGSESKKPPYSFTVNNSSHLSPSTDRVPSPFHHRGRVTSICSFIFLLRSSPADNSLTKYSKVCCSAIMRFTPIVAWAVLAYGSLADDAQKVLSDESSSSAAESATASVDASLPTFTVSSTPQPPAFFCNKGGTARHRACAWSSPHVPPLGEAAGACADRSSRSISC